MNRLDAAGVKVLFRQLSELMNEKNDYLCELDGAIGDGDLGLTMSSGFTEAAKGIQDIESDPGTLISKAGMIIAQKAPSTMGTLMATGLMFGGKAISGVDEIGSKEYAQFLEVFTESLMKRGKSKPGDKTIIDVMDPAAKAAKTTENDSLEICVLAAEKGAATGLELTKTMVAAHGKAAVFREKSIGIQDSGATVGLIFVKAIKDFIVS